MIELKANQLHISFPEVHPRARCTISFQRTLRIPDDNREYPLPPGLGIFPLLHVDDYSAKLPGKWKVHGGVFMPMYQAEAMWINFSGDYPFAIKIASGKINAVSGAPWDNELHKGLQDYVVIPDQAWLDGYCVGENLIRQFIATPLGKGYTAEEQLSGEAIHGGIQLIAYPLKRDHYATWLDQTHSGSLDFFGLGLEPEHGMGLAPGGLMKQQIFEDNFGFEKWDTSRSSRCFVHILNSAQYAGVTGKKPPHKPPSAEAYSNAGLPWFEYYDEQKAALAGSTVLANLDSVAAATVKKEMKSMPDNEPVIPKVIVQIPSGGQKVREGKF